MLQTGIVQKTHHNTAEVKIIRSASCGESCAECGMCPGREVLVEAVNEPSASAGDAVLLDMSGKKVLGAAFLVYIVPLIALIAGYFIGAAVFKSENFAVLSAFILMAAAFFAIIFIDKKVKRRFTPRIVRIIPRPEE